MNILNEGHLQCLKDFLPDENLYDLNADIASVAHIPTQKIFDEYYAKRKHVCDGVNLRALYEKYQMIKPELRKELIDELYLIMYLETNTAITSFLMLISTPIPIQ